MRSGNAQSNWKERYSLEVEKQTQRYELLNRQSPTIVRQVTPEEIEAYNRAVNRGKYFKLCSYKNT